MSETRASVPFLVPKPRELTLQGGFLALPPVVPVYLPADADTRLEAAVNAFAAEAAKQNPQGPRFELTRDPDAGAVVRFEVGEHAIPTEGYELEITDAGANIRASDGAGAFYGLGALAQILRQNPETLPCLHITDAPDLAERGFMLDVSRTKVPTTVAIFALIDRLAALRYNRMQLYVEHTFAFTGHEKVWKEASALTPKDIRKIDAYCRDRFITLIPNLNGFGHFERWLKYPEYRHMAECPDGFYHDLAHAHRDPGTLKPNQESLDFMAKLYDEYLPNFSSNEFNVGGDEPWELGQGWSKPLCEEKGKQTVYLEHMSGLHKLCTERGKRMQFWADILLEHPERAGEAPADAVPVIWGYDAGHPFDTQCATLKNLGRTYLVAPGASTWNSFSSRWENARTNIEEAVAYAQKHDAAGILMTAWGDNGNHWAWPVMYPSLTLAAALAWNRVGNMRLDLEKAVDDVWFRDGGVSSSLLLEFLSTDGLFAKTVRNKSVLWEILFNPPARLTAALEGVSIAELEIVRAHLQSLQKRALLADPKGTNDFTRELLSGIRLSLLAVARGLSELDHRDDPLLRAFGFVIHEYETAWLLRARKGGLAESVGHLRRVEREMLRFSRR
jgi:hexosaminidase